MKNLIIALLLFSFCFSYSQKHLRTNTRANNIYITDWIINKPKDTLLNNKYIVLHFWTTSLEKQLDYDFIEQFNGFQEKFNQKDLYFITMTKEKKEVIQNYFKNKAFISIVVSDQKGITYRTYGSKDGSIETPLTILIDKKGMIKWIGFPYYLNDQIINDFINDKLEPYSMFVKPN